MKYSSQIVKKWNQSYFSDEPVLAHGLPNILWGVVTESGSEMFNTFAHSEVALVYEAGNWLFIGKSFSQKEIVAAFTSGKLSAESVAAYTLVEDVLRWIQEVEINQWGTMAAQKLYGICNEHGSSEVMYALIAFYYKNPECIKKAVKSIANTVEISVADDNIVCWVDKILAYLRDTKA